MEIPSIRKDNQKLKDVLSELKTRILHPQARESQFVKGPSTIKIQRSTIKIQRSTNTFNVQQKHSTKTIQPIKHFRHQATTFKRKKYGGFD